MKAFALESTDKPAALVTVPKPDVGEADVLVAVRAASADVDQLATRGVIGHNVNAVPTADKLRLLGELASSRSLGVLIQGVYMSS